MHANPRTRKLHRKRWLRYLYRYGKQRKRSTITRVYSADKISDVEAIGEPAGGKVRRIINAIRRRICTSSGGQVVVVAGVHQRVSKHEERPGGLGLRSNKSHSQNQAQRNHPKTVKDYWWHGHERERSGRRNLPRKDKRKSNSWGS